MLSTSKARCLNPLASGEVVLSGGLGKEKSSIWYSPFISRSSLYDFLSLLYVSFKILNPKILT